MQDEGLFTSRHVPELRLKKYPELAVEIRKSKLDWSFKPRRRAVVIVEVVEVVVENSEVRETPVARDLKDQSSDEGV